MTSMRMTAVAIASMVLLMVVGCGRSERSSTTPTAMSGTCAADSAKYPDFSPLTAELVNAALGPGQLTVNGTIRPDASGVPATGSCTYFLTASSTDHQVMLGLNQKTDLFSSLAGARTVAGNDPNAHPIPGVDGFVIDKVKSYVDGSRGQVSYGVAFTGPDTLIWVSVLTPEKANSPSRSADAVAALKRAVKGLSARL